MVKCFFHQIPRRSLLQASSPATQRGLSKRLSLHPISMPPQRLPRPGRHPRPTTQWKLTLKLQQAVQARARARRRRHGIHRLGMDAPRHHF